MVLEEELVKKMDILSL